MEENNDSSFVNNNGERESRRKRRRSSGLDARVTTTVQPRTFSEQVKGRGAKSTHPVKKNTLERYSFSFEKASQLRPILRVKSPNHPAPPLDQNSHTARRILFRKSQDVVVEITPLDDKPNGVVRMPDDTISPDCQEDDVIEIDEHQDAAENANFFGVTQPTSPVAISPRALSFTPNGSPEKVSTRNSSETVLSKIQWSAEEGEVCERAVQLSKSSINTQTKLWSSVFMPRNKEEFIDNKLELGELCAWFDAWRKRVFIQEDSKGSDKKRRRKTAAEEESNLVCSSRETSNPLVISGPCGSGKTSAVYCVAGQFNARVIEFSTADKRSGSTLEEKLTGALESHNVNKERDVRGMFGPKASHASSSQSGDISPLLDFSVILIDDCDIIYSSDDRFWRALKTMCDESKIPIVLTCTDYSSVKKKLKVQPAASYRSIHLRQPSTLPLARHIRAWITGFAQKLLTIAWLKSLIEEHHHDVRAILNGLQFQISSGHIMRKPDVPKCEMPLRYHLRRISALCQLDAAYGKPAAITWRARQIDDIDYQQGGMYDDRPALRSGAALEEPIQSLLLPYFEHQQFSGLTCLSDSPFLPNEAVRDCCLRSAPRRVHCVKDVAVDYMSTLNAVNQSWYRRQVEKQRRTVSSGRGRILHPFDAICPTSGMPVDTSQKLKHSIGKYTFSSIYRPTYCIE